MKAVHIDKVVVVVALFVAVVFVTFVLMTIP